MWWRLVDFPGTVERAGTPVAQFIFQLLRSLQRSRSMVELLVVPALQLCTYAECVRTPSWPAVAWVKSLLDVVGDCRPGSRAYHNSGVTAMRMRYSAATETTLADRCRVTQYHFAAV